MIHSFNASVLLGCLVIQGFVSVSTCATATGQQELTVAQWRNDLEFLQKTVHEKYSFLFKKTTAERFDQAVKELNQAIPDLEPHEIVVGLSRIVSSFKYGHTDLAIARSPIEYHRLPINFYEFNDGVFLQAVQEKDRDALGAQVLQIAGMPIKEAIEAIRPTVPVENEQYLKAYGLGHLGIPEVLHAQKVIPSLTNEITLKLTRDGKTFDKTFVAQSRLRVPTQYGFVPQGNGWLDARDQNETPLYLKHRESRYVFEYLPKHKTLYVRQSQMLDDKQEKISSFYERVFEFIEENDVERMVLDVRLNSGGNNYKNKPIVTGIIGCKKIDQKGKLYVIIGRRTFSACQNLVNELDTYTEAIFVGEPTSENVNFYGDSRRVVLPNSKIPVALSFAWWQDKPQWANAKWLSPSVKVDMSFEQYQNNQDPVLDAILNADE